MKITKPSQLREGMKLKGKYIGIPISGYAAHTKHGTWCIIPQAIAFASDVSDEIYYQFTDLESVEGIRAAKEGDVLVNGDDKCKLFLVSDIGVIRSYVNDLEEPSGYFYTWKQLEDEGWKLKGEPSPEADPIESKGRKIKLSDHIIIVLENKNYKYADVLDAIKGLEPIN